MKRLIWVLVVPSILILKFQIATYLRKFNESHLVLKVFSSAHSRDLVTPSTTNNGARYKGRDSSFKQTSQAILHIYSNAHKINETGLH